MPRDKRWTTEAVRALATCLIGTYGAKNKRLTKDELVEGLKKVQEAERQVRATVYAEVLDHYSSDNDYDRDVNRFMSMLADETIELDTLATGALEVVEKHHHTNTSVIKRGIPIFKNAVRMHPKARLIDEERLEGALEALSFLKREDRRAIDAEYAVVVGENSRNRIETSPSYLYEHAKKVLSNLDNPEFMWKDLSIALSFATGRRMSEIHTSLTTFTEVEGEEYKIAFYGQRKKALSKVKEYVIPTTVPAKWVLKGMEKLKEMGRIYDNPKQVNKLLNKGLNSELPLRLSKLYKQAGIEIYHDIRCLYGLVMETVKPYEYTQNAWYSYLLGHNEEDLKTSNSYQAFVTREQFDPVDFHPTYTNPVQAPSVAVVEDDTPPEDAWAEFDALEPDSARLS
ncbi:MULTISPECIES: protelomerase family protein [unclassified Microcoleus]|uniref:protelomerase family protein n=1 Tax=unclassified Microcoleus TaxID=2642155 RepID=UPI002FD2A88C